MRSSHDAGGDDVQEFLIPTDGSELAGKAVKHGIALAKAVGAKITTLTVTEPFPVFAVNPTVLTDTPASYRMHARQYAESTLPQFLTPPSGGRCMQRRACGGHAHL